MEIRDKWIKKEKTTLSLFTNKVLFYVENLHLNY